MMSRSRLKRAFSLIEFLVYLAVNAILCLVISSWMAGILSRGFLCGQTYSVQLRLLTVIDCFARDIMGAPAAIHSWLKTDKNSIVWQSGGHVTGYQWHKKQLLRIAGTYQNGVLKTKRSSLASQVSDGSFVMHTLKGRVIGVEIMITVSKNGIDRDTKQYIALRNH